MALSRKEKSNLIFYSIFLGFIVFLFFTPWGKDFKDWVSSFTLRTPKASSSSLNNKEEKNIAIDWMVLDDQNNEFWISDIDQPIFLNIWATWCGPCRSELPSILDLQEKYGDQVKFLIVSTSEPLNKIVDFKEEEGIEIPLYINGSIIPQNLYSSVFPTTFIIGKDKSITHKFEGAYDWDTESVHEILDAALK